MLLGSPEYTLQKLQRVQNFAARLVAGQPRTAHIRAVLKEPHWLPVEQRITFKVLLLAFKALNNLAPPYEEEIETMVLLRGIPDPLHFRLLRKTKLETANITQLNKHDNELSRLS